MSNLDELRNLCMSCTECDVKDKVCPMCEFDENDYIITNQLPLRYLLKGRYLVGKEVDRNGEGIGYVGYDIDVKTIVYIREFMPDNICQRDMETEKIKVISGCEIVFNENLNLFLDYFGKVAKLKDLSAFIPILDIFEENNTAYTVSEWVENITLKEFIKRSGKKTTWSVARPLFMPILSSLIKMRKVGIHHLAINPENLIVLRHGKMKLKGFAIPTIRQVDTDLRPELYDGCSALEQYIGSAELGEHTDIYGFTASLFYALTSEMPMNAVKRKNDERLLIPKSDLRVISPHVITALADGLQVFPKRRTSDFEDLRNNLSASPSISKVIEDITVDEKEKENKLIAERKKRNIKIALLSGVIALLIFAALAFFVLSAYEFNNQINSSSNVISSKAPASSLYNSSSPSSQSSSSSSTSSTVKQYIPNLVGKDYEKARQEANRGGYYEVVKSSEEFNDSHEQGVIISQSPEYKENAELNQNAIITVVVSKGSQYKTLPNVSGLTLSQAS
ncbi:MAG: PASTA domain-containing protein, partial [Clostridia bacterium]|nr:PASTA domain-containing protein [Clostridia bacterium]